MLGRSSGFTSARAVRRRHRKAEFGPASPGATNSTSNPRGSLARVTSFGRTVVRRVRSLRRVAGERRGLSLGASPEPFSRGLGVDGLGVSVSARRKPSGEDLELDVGLSLVGTRRRGRAGVAAGRWPRRGDHRPSTSRPKQHPQTQVHLPAPVHHLDSRKAAPDTQTSIATLPLNRSTRTHDDQHPRPRSVPAEPPRQLDVERVNIQVADTIEELRGPGLGQRLGQSVAPRLVFALQQPELLGLPSSRCGESRTPSAAS